MKKKKPNGLGFYWTVHCFFSTVHYYIWTFWKIEFQVQSYLVYWKIKFKVRFIYWKNRKTKVMIV